jgi:acyl carrier protein
VTGDRQQRREDLIRFVRTIQKPNASIENLDDGERLLAVGLIDSLAILQIVLYLEDTYGMDFSVLGVDPDRLGTIGGILDLIEQ